MSQWIFLDVIPVCTSSMVIYNDIKNCKISLQKVGKIQEELQFIRRPNKCNKNYQKLYNDQKKVIRIYNDYTRMVFEAKYKPIHEEGIKIWTPKQILQN